LENHSVSNSNKPHSRREFARSLAVLAATPLAATAQQPAARKDVAEALMEIVRLRHGKHLTAEQLKAIQASIARSQRSADILKQVKLSNGDEPAFIFSAGLP
jgi:hypothetical protein